MNKYLYITHLLSQEDQRRDTEEGESSLVTREKNIWLPT